MESLEQYVNQATKFLWGKKKHEIRTELIGNIKEMALEYQLRGLSATESISEAIKEFGDVRQLSRQFMEVHTMPTVHKTITLLGFVSGFALLAAVSSAAPLQISTTAPLPDCRSVNPTGAINAAFHCTYGGPWVRLSELQDEIKSAGGAVLLANQELQIGFANDKSIVRFSIKNPEPLTPVPGGMPEFVFYQFYSFQRDGETFININTLLENVIRQSQLVVQLEGWQNPNLLVGKTKLTIGTTQTPFIAQHMYSFTLTEALRLQLPNRDQDTKFGKIWGVQYQSADSDNVRYTFKPHRLELLDKSNGIYAVVSQNIAGNLRGTFQYTIAQSQNGILEIALPSQKANFVGSFKDMLGTASELEQNMVLIKLTGQLNGNTFTVVQPKNTFSLAGTR